MGTGFDAFTPAFHHGSLEVTPEAHRHLPQSARHRLLSDSVLGERGMMG